MRDALARLFGLRPGREAHPPTEPVATALATASRLVGRDPPYDPQIAAEALGIEVLFAEFDDGDRRCAGFIDPAAATIYVDATLEPEAMMLTIARQLGHHLMHEAWTRGADYAVEERGTPRTPEQREADAFARRFLVPAATLRRYAPVAATPSLARMFCVEGALVRRRMAEVGL